MNPFGRPNCKKKKTQPPIQSNRSQPRIRSRFPRYPIPLSQYPINQHPTSKIQHPPHRRQYPIPHSQYPLLPIQHPPHRPALHCDLETEIKLRLARAAQAKPLLARLGFRIVKRRVFEINLVFDTVSSALRQGRMLLRLPEARRVNPITFKRPPVGRPPKTREDLETEFADFASMQRILMDLGFRQAFRYEKYRTEFAA